ncbi:MAG: hypothetical protein ACOYMR_02830 [Ilumatobacteraceae bacterium]
MSSRFAPTKIASFAAAGLLVLSACGGGSSTPSTTPADADVVVRAIDGISWNSKSYKATATDGAVSIFGVNDSALAHNLYVLGDADKVIGTPIDLPERGSEGTVVLDLAPGSYRIVCKIPGHTNMDSTLTVS